MAAQQALLGICDTLLRNADSLSVRLKDASYALLVSCLKMPELRLNNLGVGVEFRRREGQVSPKRLELCCMLQSLATALLAMSIDKLSNAYALS
jgi:hypothetical protein